MNRRKPHLEYLYRCTSQGTVNNGLKKDCQFEHVFESGDHHCPLCGNPLMVVPDGPSVSDLLRKGQLEEQARKKK